MDRALVAHGCFWDAHCTGKGVVEMELLVRHICYPCVAQHSNCGYHRCQAVWDRCCHDKELLELSWGSGAGGNGKWTQNGVAWLPGILVWVLPWCGWSQGHRAL